MVLNVDKQVRFADTHDPPRPATSPAKSQPKPAPILKPVLTGTTPGAGATTDPDPTPDLSGAPTADDMVDIRRRVRIVSCENASKFQVAEVFSPTTTMETIRLVIALACDFREPLVSYDVHGAYLWGKRPPGSPEVFLRRPKAIEKIGIPTKDANGKPLFWRVVSNHYGLRDAGTMRSGESHPGSLRVHAVLCVQAVLAHAPAPVLAEAHSASSKTAWSYKGPDDRSFSWVCFCPVGHAPTKLY